MVLKGGREFGRWSLMNVNSALIEGFLFFCCARVMRSLQKRELSSSWDGATTLILVLPASKTDLNLCC
jgi:hypothetical protein